MPLFLPLCPFWPIAPSFALEKRHENLTKKILEPLGPVACHILYPMYYTRTVWATDYHIILQTGLNVSVYKGLIAHKLKVGLGMGLDGPLNAPLLRALLCWQAKPIRRVQKIHWRERIICSTFLSELDFYLEEEMMEQVMPKKANIGPRLSSAGGAWRTIRGALGHCALAVPAQRSLRIAPCVEQEARVPHQYLLYVQLYKYSTPLSIAILAGWCWYGPHRPL